jgi:ubiquinone/menaquinone biosynthesis C-methylase UbiE
VGTGTGRLALRQVAEDGDGQVVGLDSTPDMLARALRNAQELDLEGKISLVQAGATCLPYPDSSFDVVISSLALHHTDVSTALDEIVRVLRPGGRVIIMDMGAPPAWRTPPVSWLMVGLRWVYGLMGGVQGRAEADAFDRTYTANEWQSLLATSRLLEARVMEVRRPGQRIYPCVIFAAGEKGLVAGEEPDAFGVSA